MPFFKKADPKVKVIISNGTPIQFEAISNQVGIYPPEGKGMSETLANEFRLCIKGERGGIEEITQQEHANLIELKKKSGPLKPLWREELSSRNFPSIGIPAKGHRPAPPVATANKAAPPPVG